MLFSIWPIGPARELGHHTSVVRREECCFVLLHRPFNINLNAVKMQWEECGIVLSPGRSICGSNGQRWNESDWSFGILAWRPLVLFHREPLHIDIFKSIYWLFLTCIGPWENLILVYFDDTETLAKITSVLLLHLQEKKQLRARLYVISGNDVTSSFLN